MIVDLTPSMTFALANIGKRSVSASDIGVNGGVLKRLWELGFLRLDLPTEGRFPAYYSLAPKGEGAAAILTATPAPVEREGAIARIQRITAGHFHIPVEEMISDRRAKKVARPRQVAMYLAKRFTPYSLPTIGRYFGGRDHTTVIHAVKTVERLMREDQETKHALRTIMAELVSPSEKKPVEKSHENSFFAARESA